MVSVGDGREGVRGGVERGEEERAGKGYPVHAAPAHSRRVHRTSYGCVHSHSTEMQLHRISAWWLCATAEVETGLGTVGARPVTAGTSCGFLCLALANTRFGRLETPDVSYAAPAPSCRACQLFSTTHHFDQRWLPQHR